MRFTQSWIASKANTQQSRVGNCVTKNYVEFHRKPAGRFGSDIQAFRHNEPRAKDNQTETF